MSTWNSRDSQVSAHGTASGPVWQEVRGGIMVGKGNPLQEGVVFEGNRELVPIEEAGYKIPFQPGLPDFGRNYLGWGP